MALRRGRPSQSVQSEPPRLANLPRPLRARLDEIRLRAAGYVTDFLPRDGGAETIAAFTGEARWSHHGAFYQPMIAAPAWALLDREGKRWRATLAIVLLEALGEREARFDREIALIAELLHTASLIVDDIEDGAELRRGGPAVHKTFGLDVALNAANAMYFLPLLSISQNPHLEIRQREELYRTLIEYFVRGHFGQANDIYFSTQMSRGRLARWLRPETAAEILQMYVGKTAAWPMGLTEAAAIMTCAPAEIRQAAAAFSRDFGVAFQMMADVHGIAGMPGNTKTPGEDIAAGKLTYLTHKALTRLRGGARRRLLDIIGGRLGRNDASVVEEGTALIAELGAIAACRAEAWDLFRAAWSAVTGALLPTPSLRLIGALCASLLAE